MSLFNILPFVSSSYIAFRYLYCLRYLLNIISIQIFSWTEILILHQLLILKFSNFIIRNQKEKKEKWQCSQNLNLNPTYVVWTSVQKWPLLFLFWSQWGKFALDKSEVLIWCFCCQKMTIFGFQVRDRIKMDLYNFTNLKSRYVVLPKNNNFSLGGGGGWSIALCKYKVLIWNFAQKWPLFLFGRWRDGG